MSRQRRIAGDRARCLLVFLHSLPHPQFRGLPLRAPASDAFSVESLRCAAVGGEMLRRASLLCGGWLLLAGCLPGSSALVSPCPATSTKGTIFFPAGFDFPAWGFDARSHFVPSISFPFLTAACTQPLFLSPSIAFGVAQWPAPLPFEISLVTSETSSAIFECVSLIEISLLPVNLVSVQCSSFYCSP